MLANEGVCHSDEGSFMPCVVILRRRAGLNIGSPLKTPAESASHLSPRDTMRRLTALWATTGASATRTVGWHCADESRAVSGPRLALAISAAWARAWLSEARRLPGVSSGGSKLCRAGCED